MQLATYAGWLLHGVRGGLVAGLLFLLPGSILIVALSAAYMLAGDLGWVQGLLFGLKAAVLAVVLEALVKVSKRALKGPAMVAIAVAAFLAIAFLGVPFPVVIVLAAAIGAGVHLAGARAAAVRNGAEAVEAAAVLADWTRPSLRRFLVTAAVWLAIWFVPLLLLRATFGGAHVFAVEASFFSAMATVSFGGAYAVLAYVAQQAVEVHQWLRPDEMLTGLGLAETTPGPLILVLVFVGFLGGARFSGLEPLAGGLVGALVTLWFTFVPCFLWIFVGAPYVETLRGVRWLATALAGVTAAVVGVIANLALWFGLHVLFADLEERRVGMARLLVPDLASFDALAAAIAVVAAVLLLRLHWNLMLVLSLAALVGVALRS